MEVADLSGDVVLLHRVAAELAGGGELQRLRRHQDDSAIGPAGASNGGRHALAQVLARRRVVQAALQHDDHALVVVGLDDREAGDVAAAHILERFRSEEHTSELKSIMRNSYAVFCLKKKTSQT